MTSYQAERPSTEFHRFLNDHIGIIRRICKVYSNDADEYQDYFQEVVLQLWKAYGSFRGDAQASTWVYRVALNVCLSLLKRQKRRVSAVSLQPEHWSNLAAESTDTAEEEQLKQLYAAIRQLSEIDRALILLYLEGKKYEEIADILGISLSNVGVKVNRIKKQLNRIIHGQSTNTLA
ncbi:MAG: RNA polymerase sigma factor [Tunicatimonas sp.]